MCRTSWARDLARVDNLNGRTNTPRWWALTPATRIQCPSIWSSFHPLEGNSHVSWVWLCESTSGEEDTLPCIIKRTSYLKATMTITICTSCATGRLATQSIAGYPWLAACVAARELLATVDQIVSFHGDGARLVVVLASGKWYACWSRILSTAESDNHAIELQERGHISI